MQILAVELLSLVMYYFLKLVKVI